MGVIKASIKRRINVFPSFVKNYFILYNNFLSFSFNGSFYCFEPGLFPNKFL